MESLFNILQCKICYEHFQLKLHEPFSLICGHTICSKSTLNLYINNQIICPFCKRINKYESFDQISKNIMIIEILEETLKFKNISIKNMEDQLKQLDTLIDAIQLENQQIEKYVKKIIEKRKISKEYNTKVIDKIKAYRELIKADIYALSIKGIPQQRIEKVTSDIEKFSQTFLTLETFIKQQELQLEELEAKIKEVQNSEIISDYATFKTNVLRYMDQGIWKFTFKYIVKQKNFLNILNLLQEFSQTNVNDLSVYAFINCFGIGVEKNKNVVKELMKNGLVNANGRALYLKYRISNKKYPQQLIRSAFLGYSKSFAKVGYFIKDLSNDQIDVLLQIASSNQGSTFGMNNLAWNLENGQGIKKDKKTSIEYYLKVLENGYLSKKAKKEVDHFYEENEEFRLQYPNYQKWDKSYDEFQTQDIVLL